MYKHIMIALDGSHNANPALLEAIRLASYSHARLSLVHVISVHDFAVESVGLLDSAALLTAAEQQGSKILEEASLKARLAQVTDVSTTLLQAPEGGDSLAHALLAHAEKESSDLLVIGTHGHKGWKHLLMGSFAEDIMRRTNIPLLVVRNPEDDDNRTALTAG